MWGLDCTRIVKKTFLELIQEKQADANDGDDGTKDGTPSDFLVEEPVRRQNDDDGCHSHQGGGDASTSILHSHEREAHPNERSKDSGGCGNAQALFVVHGFTQRLESITIPQSSSFH